MNVIQLLILALCAPFLAYLSRDLYYLSREIIKVIYERYKDRIR